MTRRPRIAVVGGGISGLGAAARLAPHCDVTVFEADARLGGHAHTVDLTLPGPDGPVTHGVDTGFLVFNRRTYPRLVALFAELGVDCAASEMTFSVQAPRGAAGGGRLEWAGTNLNTVFADRANLLRPRFHGMLLDLLRFNRLTTALAERDADADTALAQPLDEFLAAHRFGTAFRDDYLLPMIGCIWSCPPSQMLRFPVGTLIRFCHNHGLLQVRDRPQWYTVRGGSRHYVERLAERVGQVRLSTPVLGVTRSGAPAGGVAVHTAAGTEAFDDVVLACHAPQALAMLHDADGAERRTLGALRTQDNEAVLHVDDRVLPRRRAAWASWNYHREDAAHGAHRVCLHYLLNKLQPLPWTQPVIVSLNPIHAPRPQTVLGRFHYAHPVFDLDAVAAQGQLHALQGERGTWFCGAWTGFGFHEDGLKSGLAVAERLLARHARGVDDALDLPLREAA